MNNTPESIQYIQNAIMQNKKPSYLTTNRKELRVRCPYCGDSSKNLSAAHLYIAMTPPFKFHCFKCETSGVLNQHVLNDMGVYVNDLPLSILNANKVLKKTSTAAVKFKKQDLKYPKVNDGTAAQNYFNSRYGVNLDADYITSKFKAVLDAEAFFTANNLHINMGQYDFKNSIGFISSDTSHAVFRDVTGQQERRYSNLNLFQDENGSKIYNISSDISLTEKKVRLVITEGIFDIIGVYLHFYKDTPAEENTIFAAACGKGFNAVISHFARMGFLDMDVIIYSDGDVSLQKFREIKKNSIYIKNSKLTIFYNNLYDPTTGFGKDYGVPKDCIELRKVVIV